MQLRSHIINRSVLFDFIWSCLVATKDYFLQLNWSSKIKVIADSKELLGHKLSIYKKSSIYNNSIPSAILQVGYAEGRMYANLTPTFEG